MIENSPGQIESSIYARDGEEKWDARIYRAGDTLASTYRATLVAMCPLTCRPRALLPSLWPSLLHLGAARAPKREGRAWIDGSAPRVLATSCSGPRARLHILSAATQPIPLSIVSTLFTQFTNLQFYAFLRNNYRGN